MNIGISVISYNRPKEALETLHSILDNLDFQKHTYNIYCCVDSENIEEYTINLPKEVKIIYHPNFGVAINKSIALSYIKNCDHMFLIEDDILFQKKNWVDLFLSAHSETKIGLFNSVLGHTKENYKFSKYYVGERVYKSCTLVHFVVHTAQIMSIPKSTFQKIGYLSPKFNGYGFGHCQYTLRCALSGLHPINTYPFIKELWDYVNFLDCPSATPNNIKAKQIEENRKWYYETLKNKGPIFIGEEEITSFINQSKIFSK